MNSPKPACDKIDRLKYFAKDDPAVRLKALLIERSPAILAGAAGCISSSLGIAFWIAYLLR